MKLANPSTDMVGVKRWAATLTGETTLYVFKRPPRLTDMPYMLRVDTLDGRTLETRYAARRATMLHAAHQLGKKYAPKIGTAE